ncbi:hypothetical protein E6P09_08505 [Haloferax mediterranei ATCC 33500]|uniref:Uncharacterized protein n=1 Tax=Haloferax mediterranei (strain ATCC 33500 / DSM 1411 / JCM 8866 / NBRC 14739 / NCIMB 2177 / R-4) TaxID=523841 RepID=I3R3K2_HALMT|nr:MULTISPECIES: hypothetical protein [Haloferacaceae]AFK18812.1 hypothetical protein HFX_1096 [Haloferax mediterranei ATCC 33500]AHZ21821.1 hypothetical protein BM92_03735 [Haloferax mediterranei ATCC 33500]EMA03330.1 hypothetical protein C439_05010 [Haloferax mediterranei ATCC 33500]MDX5988905.1 hypothetical protein [Haloferax mediterranei ATCC 33500]QCQ75303.1 hypothetical protein E6P09_08505 [Haloferax mediterranei ATCC 33500]
MYLSTDFPGILVVLVPSVLIFLFVGGLLLKSLIAVVGRRRRELEQRVEELEDDVARLETRIEEQSDE